MRTRIRMHPGLWACLLVVTGCERTAFEMPWEQWGAGDRPLTCADVRTPPGDCVGTLRSCGESACATDVSIDPDHCGRCGTRCESGECVGGVCTPWTFAADQDGVERLGITSDRIVWIRGGEDEGGVWAAPIEGGAPERLTEAQGIPESLTTDDAHVYWIGYQGGWYLRALRADGGPATQLTTPRSYARLLFHFDGVLYWFEPHDGGAVMRLVLPAARRGTLALSDRHLYLGRFGEIQRVVR